MSSSQARMNRSLSKSSTNSKKTVNTLGLGATSGVGKVAASPTNSKQSTSQHSATSRSKEKPVSSSKSTFKLYVDKKRSTSISKKEVCISKEDKENFHPNIKNNKDAIDNKPKARKLKEVRLGIAKPEAVTKKISQPLQQRKKYVRTMSYDPVKDAEPSLLAQKPTTCYIPRAIVEDFKKASLQDFCIMRQIQQEQCSSQYIAYHKKLKCLFTIKKFNKNLVVEQQLLNQLVQSIKIHFYLNEISIGENIQKIYTMFHDLTSVYLVLQPILPNSVAFNPLKTNQQNVSSFYEVVSSLHLLHGKGIVLRNLALKSIRNQMGVFKITNIIRAASFSGKKRRQSFFGNIEEAPHQLLKGQSYDSSYDMWSLGLLLYELILKFSPFSGKQAMKAIKSLEYRLPITLPNDLAVLLSRLLCEQDKRITPGECLKLAPFTMQGRESNLVSRDIYNFWMSQ